MKENKKNSIWEPKRNDRILQKEKKWGMGRQDNLRKDKRNDERAIEPDV